MESIWLLVVDDEPDIRDTLVDLLTAEGYGVRVAADGVEALELLQTLRPALVILDLRMPRKTGLEVLAAMRSDPSLALVPAIVLTAESPAPRIEGAAYLQKPVRAETLINAIRGLLAQSAAA